MRIAIASDHAGFALKQHVRARLRAAGHEVEDYGVHDERPADYPDVGRPASRAVSHGKAERAILIDGAGIAMGIVANRVPFVRAVVASEPGAVEMARGHNDANVLCLGGRMIDTAMADRLVDVFLSTPFEGGRHERRVAKIDA